MKLLIVVGTRPEAIKLAPVAKAGKERENVEVIVLSTGQHKEMLGQTCKALEMQIDDDLQVMAEGNSLSDVAAKVLEKTDKFIKKEKPDWVIVQGDTASAFAGGLAGFYNKVKVAHVEAGLRSFDNYNPYPEEVNRKLIGAFADIHFAPTEISKENLITENIDENNIVVSGNTVIDALKTVKEKIENSSELQNSIEKELPKFDKDKKLILLTSHRRENHGDGLKNICEAVKELAEQRDDIEFIYPVHLNPNVKNVVHDIIGNVKNIHLTEPVNYLTMVYLMAKSHFILTDSGGIQEEASAFSTPVLVLRKTTERSEGVDAGIAKLIGTEKKDIINESLNLLNNNEEFIKMCREVSPYGDGLSSLRIIDELIARN
jgi:UDP-N-acetylglucosamine 2-epimerase (non-hydrolysing)